MLRLRDATDADVPAILEIYNHAIATSTAVFSYAPHTLEMRREWLAAKRDVGHPVLAADIDGVVAGFAAYGPFRAWPAYKYTVEHSIYVGHGYRRRGVGRALLQALIAAARVQQRHALIGGIVADNAASLALHRSLGFQDVAHFREVGYKFGRWLDLKFVELVLETPDAPSEG